MEKMKQVREVRCPVCGYYFRTATAIPFCPRCENDFQEIALIGGEW